MKIRITKASFMHMINVFCYPNSYTKYSVMYWKVWIFQPIFAHIARSTVCKFTQPSLSLCICRNVGNLFGNYKMQYQVLLSDFCELCFSVETETVVILKSMYIVSNYSKTQKSNKNCVFQNSALGPVRFGIRQEKFQNMSCFCTFKPIQNLNFQLSYVVLNNRAPAYLPYLHNTIDYT